jgi:hypothetical protein
MGRGAGELAAGFGQVAKVFGQVTIWRMAVSGGGKGNWSKVTKAAKIFCCIYFVGGGDGMTRVYGRFATKTQRQEDSFLTVDGHGAMLSFYKGRVRPLCARAVMRICG